MLSNDFIAISFKIINFVIVISVLLYIFKQYFLNNIKSYMLEYKNNFNSLKNKTKELKTTLEKTNLEIHSQEILSKDLLTKIQKWNNEYKNKEDKDIEEIELINEKINRKIKLQEKLLTLDNLKQNIVPIVIERAKLNLVEQFKIENNIRQFQREIIEFMKKN